SDRSGASVLTISSSWARRICAESCDPMLAITTTFEHIGHWIKMRQSLARFSGPESSPQIRSLSDFIATTSGFSFSVHTAVELYQAQWPDDKVQFPVDLQAALDQ